MLTQEKIDKLNAQRGVVTTEALKAAIDTQLAEATKAQTKGLIVALDAITGITNSAVDALKRARKVEATRLEELERVSDAQDAFQAGNKAGDIESYAAAIYPKDEYARETFLRPFQGTLFVP